MTDGRPTYPDLTRRVVDHLASGSRTPLFVAGDAREVLTALPAASVDVVMTSPPYWGHREYAGDGIGLESTRDDYLAHLLAVCAELHRVLKPTGSFWLNLGDTYRAKGLQLIPWRVALALVDDQDWVLRNHVVWNKVKGGPDNARDKLRNLHEPVLHLVKDATRFHYDVDAIRSAPGRTKVVNGRTVSATGVSGVRYRRRIELSTALDDDERLAALEALDAMLVAVEQGELSDFRMVVRGSGRVTHSDSERVSGRAKELRERGFYFLRYHPRGAKPSDVWEIMPEDTHGRDGHFAAYPQDLCRIPLLATCPEAGVVLDPFCGTGTTNLVAQQLDRPSIGIDLAPQYLTAARRRCEVPDGH
jgi:DNA modification methylase